MTAEAPLRRTLSALAVVVGTAALWVALYKLNEWAFAFSSKTEAAAWIFLPAALRLVAVLVWGVAGALGLWLGAIVTASMVFGVASPMVIVAAPVNGLAPLLAVAVMRGPLALRPDLGGLSAGALAQLAVANATCSALLHSLVFFELGDPRANPADIFTMLIGDLVGTLVVLYALKLLLVALPGR